MPALNYLDDEEELYPRPEDDEDGSFDVSDAPVPSGISKPSPELQRLIANRPAPLPYNEAPVVKGAEDARQKYAATAAGKPDTPEPKWWQRGLAGIAGGLAGWSNAAGRTKNPIDIQQMSQAIEAPGYGRKLADWKNRVSAADAQKGAAEANETAWWKNRQLQSDEEHKQAQEDRDRATADWESGRNQTALEGKKIADAEKRDKDVMGNSPDAMMIDSAEKASVPPGWQAIPSVSRPGMLIVKPPSFVKLPPELVPYSSGGKAGDVVAYSRFKAAQDAAAKDTLQQNKPVKTPAATEVELASIATDPSKSLEERAAADAALKRLDQSKVAARPVTNNNFAIPGLNDPAKANLTGQEFLSSLPAGTAAQVKAIAEGRSVLPPFGSRGFTASLRDAVFRYDPTFNEQRAQIRRAFTTGKQGDNIGSLNTATVHLDQLDEVARAMQNGSFRPGNDIWNRASAAFGSSAPTNFDTLKAAVAGEMANALKGNATDVEIATMGHNLQSANSPQQLADAIQENLRLLGGKLSTYAERYSQQAPDDTTWNPVMPSARAVFTKHQINPTAGPQTNISGTGGRGGRSNPNPNGYVKDHIYGGLKYLGGDPGQPSSWGK